jgi:hypothetical protein
MGTDKKNISLNQNENIKIRTNKKRKKIMSLYENEKSK